MMAGDENQSCEGCSICDKSIFRVLKEESLEFISQHKTRYRFKKGQVIFNESNIPGGIYAINTGSVKISKEGKGDKEQILRFAGEGTILGYRSILSNENFGVSATALENVDLCFLPRTEFLKLVSSDINFTKELLKGISMELGLSRSQIVGITQNSVKERVAGALINLQSFYGLAQDSNFLSKKVSRTNLAQLTGTSLESVVRILKELKEEGYIELDGKLIKINDTKKLMSLVS